jgi:hypothetical protein
MPLYDNPSAAKYLLVSESWLNKSRLTGRGPAYLKIGAKVVYQQADLDAWLASCRRTSTSASKMEAA